MTAPARVTPLPTRSTPLPRAYERPVAGGRVPRGRRAVLGSFALVVLLPMLLAVVYLERFAVDQYASTVGFSVRHEEAPSPLDFLGVARGFGTGTSDADIIHAYLQSPDLIAAVEARVGLRAAWEAPWPQDPVFALRPGGTIEDLAWHWWRNTRLTYDSATGLIELEVFAFDPATAQAAASAAFAASGDLINRLSDLARADVLDEAERQVRLAADRLSDARVALTAFRTRTQIVDPGADLGGQMGILTHLQAELADELVRLDLLRGQTRDSDPRIARATERIAVIEARIADERAKLGGGTAQAARADEDYAAVMADFERLSVEVEFAREAYLAARAGLDAAEAEARRQSRYLAAHITPTRAERPTGPDPWVILGGGGLGLLLIWSVGALTIASLRERV